MFVSIREEFQISEQVKFRPISSIVWLKTFYFAMRSRQDVLECSNASAFVSHSGGVVIQGELNRPFFFRRKFCPRLPNIQHGKVPGDMVKRSPEISNNITDNETPILSPQGRIDLNVNQLCLALHYGLFFDGALWIEQSPNTPFESVDVYVRPLNLKPGAIEWVHMLYYPQGESQ